jgi:two-component system chemotaxis response regulator CheB
MRLLIVDDTALYRKLLTDAATPLSGVEVAGAVSSGPLALARIAAEPIDLVLLDVFMPEMNGPEVLTIIRRDFPKIAVVMISGATGADASITINALANGALDFIPKPQTTSFAEGMTRLRGQLQHVVNMVNLRRINTAPAAPRSAPTPTALGAAATASGLFGNRVATAPAPATPAQPTRRRVLPPATLDILLIGVSTGGPRTLQDLLPALPADFRLPVVIVQHMPPLFTRTLAEQLDKVCNLRVSEAIDGEPVVAGRILIAPGGRHLEITRNAEGALVTRLTDAAPVNSCRPAVDVLFDSASRCALRGAISLILTGMGEDGAAGVATLKAAVPTWSIAQDEATSVIYGMPQAVVRRQLEDEILALPAISPRLTELAQSRQ